MPKKLVPSPLCPSEKVTEEQLATDRAVLDLDAVVHPVNRRSFFSSLTALGAAAAAAGFLGATPKARAQAIPPGATGTEIIIGVLNFALNLEYLEANLYIAVSGGTPLTDLNFQGLGLGGGAAITGLPNKLNLDAVTMATAQNLASDETRHIGVLRAAILELGGTPIDQPVIDYSLGGKMSITTQAQFLAVARQFTRVGIAAFGGAAWLLVSNPLVLTVAGQILGAEAQHLGGINVLCDLQGVVSPKVDAQDYPPVPPNQYFTLTPNTLPPTQGPALGLQRTPQQILGIVYGVTTATSPITPPTGVSKGGFFPNGVNGFETTT